MESERIQKTILETLDHSGIINNSADLTVLGAPLEGICQQSILGTLKRLAGHEMVEYEVMEVEEWKPTEEGKKIAEEGSYEFKVFSMVPHGEEGLPLQKIYDEFGENGKLGLGRAFKNKWIRQKDSTTVIRCSEDVKDICQSSLRKLISGEVKDITEQALKELKHRKLVELTNQSSFKVRKGKAFALNLTKLATDLTYELVQDGSWSQAGFKQYNFSASGIPTSGGHLHPLLKVREEFRQIFFELGFEEMPTNRFVESSFWNFDTLFQPQAHPSRDSHDTFFLSQPRQTKTLPMDYVERTKMIHSKGGYGSIGHGYEWKEAEARKNILRTHTTAISSQMLYKLAMESKFRPVKYFSIDRVFRNETLDATHLAEFHQIEGVVVDKGLTLGHLIGIFSEFFKKMGITKLRFKPAFNPYTEPSMEIFAFHEGLKRWIEVGNSGVFRPEMLLPMGFAEDVVVIAWGLSLERPTMIKYGLSNIRDLVGHKVDLAVVQSNPICRLDK